jgi:pimeloyl-ACP methyl ester carboxylesterase
MPIRREQSVSTDVISLTPGWFEGADGVWLAADIGGSDDAPPVLFLHGGGQTRRSWRSAALAVAASGRRAISLDLRGHGESGWSPDGIYTIDTYVADLKAILEQVGPMPVLVGASLGGFTSLTCIGESRTPIASGLVLVDIAPNVNPEGVGRIVAFMTSRPDGFADIEEALEAVASYNPNRARPGKAENLRGNLREGEDGRLYWHWDPNFMKESRLDPAGLADRYEAAALRVTVPTMLVRGASSDIVDEASAERFRALMPEASVFDVAGAGHMVAGDHNDSFNRAILDFLDSV